MQPEAAGLLWDARKAAGLIADFVGAFRNVLVHGYAVIDDELVWEVSTTRAPDLAAQLGRLLSSDDGE